MDNDTNWQRYVKVDRTSKALSFTSEIADLNTPIPLSGFLDHLKSQGITSDDVARTFGSTGGSNRNVSEGSRPQAGR